MNSTVRFGILTALMLSASCAIAHQASINGNYLAIYRTPWHMVQDLLITQPAAEVKKQHTTRRGIFKSLALGVGTGLAAAGGYWSFLKPAALTAPVQAQPKTDAEIRALPYDERQPYYAANEQSERQMENFRRDRHRQNTEIQGKLVLCGGIGTLVAGLGIAGTIVNRFFFAGPRLLRAAEMKQVGVVLDQWDEVRPYFPKSLQPIFDTLCELRRTGSAEYVINVERALAIVKSEVALNVR